MCWDLILCLQVRDVEAIVRRFKTDLHNCVGYIQDPKMLKESIKALYQKHVQEDIVSGPRYSIYTLNKGCKTHLTFVCYTHFDRSWSLFVVHALPFVVRLEPTMNTSNK